MRRSILVTFAAGLLATACSSGVQSYHARQPQLRVTMQAGCPATLGQARDVANPSDGLTRHLVPRADALGGLVCEYDGQGRTFRPDLVRRASLDRPHALDLARALRAVSLDRPSGEFNCPESSVGRHTVIVLRFAGRADVDLWYEPSGCQTVDNGHVQAFQGANPSFYDGFESAYARAVPRSTTSSSAPAPTASPTRSPTPTASPTPTPTLSAKARAAGLIDVHTVVPDAIVDLRYATSHNFVGVRLYPTDAHCLVHESMADGLRTAADRLRQQGFRLVFWDCYRPHAVQVHMFRVVADPEFVARPGPYARSHEAGRSVDVTLARRGRPIDMGTGFDNFTARAHAFATDGVSTTAQRNRAVLRHAMDAGGLTVYDGEWWHFDGPGADVHRPILHAPLH